MLENIKLDLDASQLEKHSVTIAGHRTSISLERCFWKHIKHYTQANNISVNELVRLIDEARTGSLSGALRAFVIEQLEEQISKSI